MSNILKNEMEYGAVYSKIMGIYKNRLKNEDYNHLINLNTVLDVASFLRENSTYHKTFENKDITTFHRRDLENILRSDYKNEYDRFFRFIDKEDIKLISFFQSKAEIDEILRFSLLFNLGRQETYICTLPENYLKDYKIDFKNLRKIKSYDEFLDLTKNSIYYDVFVHFKPKKDEKIDVPLMDTALVSRYYELFFQYIRKEKVEKVRKEVLKLLNVYIDIMNISRILRLKKYYHMNSEENKKYMIKIFSKKSEEIIKNLLAAENIEDAYLILDKTAYKDVFRDISQKDLEKRVLEYEYLINKKLLRITPPSVFSIIAYLNLKQIEINTLINIIEGIRYSLPKEKMKEYII